MFDARTAAGLSQPQVCAALKLAQATLSDAENSADGSSYTAQLARLYKVDAYWLATGEGHREQAPKLSRPALELARRFDAEIPELLKRSAYSLIINQIELAAHASRLPTEDARVLPIEPPRRGT